MTVSRISTTGKAAALMLAAVIALACADAHAQDGGDARVEAEVRDKVCMLDAPFDGEPTLLATLGLRYGGMEWGNQQVAFVNEWWWTASCEYADVVFGVDSWGEYNVHDITQSCTNPFMQVMPLSKIDRVHNTRSDSQVYAGVAGKLAEMTGDERFARYWHFIENGKAVPYIQRILDHSNITKGYEFSDLLEADSLSLDPTSRNIAINLSYPYFGLGWAFELRGDSARSFDNVRRGLKLHYLPEVAAQLDSGAAIFAAPPPLSDTPISQD